MKFLIIPAKDLQAGDVLFTASREQAVDFCARVIGMNSSKHGDTSLEFRVKPLGAGEHPHATLRFPLDQCVGVAREDAYVDVDVAAILADID